MLNIKKTLTTLYCSHCDSKMDRINDTIINSLMLNVLGRNNLLEAHWRKWPITVQCRFELTLFITFYCSGEKCVLVSW